MKIPWGPLKQASLPFTIHLLLEILDILFRSLKLAVYRMVYDELIPVFGQARGDKLVVPEWKDTSLCFVVNVNDVFEVIQVILGYGMMPICFPVVVTLLSPRFVALLFGKLLLDLFDRPSVLLSINGVSMLRYDWSTRRWAFVRGEKLRVWCRCRYRPSMIG
jgi:hypothetical protein